ncbi:outer membrane beta-barrel protein [Bradyrhizobium sp. SSUT18]|uniref:outer membrane protein n=1 Tax=unclassified Bradyrhizobium TaxID=2631580 RepID=UPI002447C98A|nr:MULTISPECIES: outer membrane beta-barrel protein [unclassified Bradyrhizobium]MDH2343017.1 outer membrane beta-barrel protein [Bradyrhizobium sp. SSUT77]MDH2354522.1 outer membrane beta-barrel protein [Bradyrhizobium sp. SSUT112]MDH2403634.1 outer membrane beta-barrel protein [Bradyrhizobium sp. SSUT18]
MKKILLALTAVAAMTGSASAADLAARPYVKAPMAAPVANWTGFYIFGGGGGGLSNADQQVRDTLTGTPLTISQRQGGSGWFGTVGLGYDWQFSGTWVAGVFADGQFGSIRATIQDPIFGITGNQKLEDSWAAGLRVGYLVAPNVLSYVNGGYSGAHFGQTNFMTLAGVPAGVHLNSYNRNGWFVGGGVENSLNIFGISSPGWFMKTEYRSAFYEAKTQTELLDAGNVPLINSVRANSWNQTISTSLVYRFNWTGPVVAKY